MSWFGSDPSSLLVRPTEDRRADCEIADGVTVTRRRMLFGSTGAAGALLLSPELSAAAPAEAALGGDEDETLSLDDFLASMFEQAEAVIGRGESANERSYLFRVAEMLTRLELSDDDSLKSKVRTFKQDKRVDGKRFPIHVTEMKLKPGARLAHHDHLDYNGIIVGIEGEVRIKNYHFVDSEAPDHGSDATFQIRETIDANIGSGQFSMLGRGQDNIHDLVAGPDGARVLDVFTFFSQRSRSRFLQVEDEPRDAARRVFEATWKRRPKRR